MHGDDVLAEDGDGIEESNEFLNLLSHLAQCIRALNQTGEIRVWACNNRGGDRRDYRSRASLVYLS